MPVLSLSKRPANLFTTKLAGMARSYKFQLPMREWRR